MSNLRLGLIGASTIGAEHMIGAFRALGGEAVAVMSRNGDRAESHAKKHRIAHASTRAKELVESPTWTPFMFQGPISFIAIRFLRRLPPGNMSYSKNARPDAPRRACDGHQAPEARGS